MDGVEKEMETAEDEPCANARKEVRHRKKHFYNQLRRQMEFYFSDANLTKNRYMGQRVLQDPNVELSLFLTFNKIRALTLNVEDIAKALKKSDMLAVTEDGTKVYRTTPVRENENTDDCTIYVEQLPPDADHEWLKSVFLPYGNVPYISIPKYHVSRSNKGFAFVEFDSPAAAEQALEAFGAMGCRLPAAHVPPDQLCSNIVAEGEKPFGGRGYPFEGGEVFEQGGLPVAEGAEPVVGTGLVDMFEDEKAAGEVHEVSKRKKRKDDEKETSVEMMSKEEEDARTDSKGVKSDVEEGAKKKKRKCKDVDEAVAVDLENVKLEDAAGLSEASNKHSKKHKKQGVGLEEGDLEGEVRATRKRRGDSERGEVDGEKRVKREMEEEEEVANEGEKENEGETERKKKGRRHKKKKDNRKDEHQEVDPKKNLRILSKVEWKRLRNKYLSMQKARMICLKQHLARSRWGNNYTQQQTGQESSQRETAARKGDTRVQGGEEVARPEKGKKALNFVAGAIVRVKLDEVPLDVKPFKTSARSHSDVLYVDLAVGACEAFVRCGSAEGAARLVAEAPWRQMDVLEGDEEKVYWEKITQDRDQKLNMGGGVGRAEKRRGRDKLLKKAEKALGKHIRFEERE